MARPSKNQTKKVAKKAEVALVVNKGEVSAISVLDVVNQKLDSFEGLRESNYRIPVPIIDNFNLREETSIEEIIQLHGELKLKDKLFKESQIELGVKRCKPYTQCGGSIEDWTHDMRMRIQTINEKETIDTLKGLKTKWEGRLTEDQQNEILAKETAEILSRL